MPDGKEHKTDHQGYQDGNRAFGKKSQADKGKTEIEPFFLPFTPIEEDSEHAADDEQVLISSTTRENI